MISANDISCLSTSLDVSPQCRSRTFPSPSLPTFPVNGNQDSQRYAVDEGRLTIGTPNSSVFSAAFAAGPALSLYGDRLNHRYRSPTSPPVAFPSSGHTIQRRRHALPPQIPQISYSGNSAVSPPRQTPHLITKAKPPPDSTKATDLLITKFPVQAPSPSPLSPLNLNLSSPPPTSLLFSASAQQNLSPMSPPTISVSPNSGASMAGSTATLPQNAHNVTQQLTEHQQTMDALKNQEAALAAQQAVINQQQALLEMQLLKQQQQQQQVLAQQQAFMHGDQTLNHQQQLQAMQHQIAHQHQQAIPQQPAVHLQTVPMQQTTHVPAQLSMPVQHIQQHQNQNTAPAMTSMASSNSQHQGPTSQLFMPPGSQQQSGPNTNTNSLVSQVGHHVATHLVNSIMGNGSNQGDSTSSTTSPGATDSSAAGGGGWDSLAQTLNGVVGGNNQDPSQGLFGGMSQSWVDGIGNVDLGALSTGFDSSSFGGDFTEC